MAISNYTELQAAIADYLARSDLTTQIADFIKLAESRMNRSLRVRDMETSATVTMSSGSGSLPSDYLEWISAVWDGSARDQELRYVEPDSEEWRFRYRPNGDPSMFTILAGTLKLRPVTTGNVNLVYYASIPALASNSTNWLLTRAPDMYLNFSLAEAYILIKDHVKAKDFMGLAGESLSQMNMDADGNKLARRPSGEAAIADIASARNPATSGR